MADARALERIESPAEELHTLDSAARSLQLSQRQIVLYWREGLVSTVVDPLSFGWYFNDEGMRALRRLERLRTLAGGNLSGVHLIVDLEDELDRLGEVLGEPARARAIEQAHVAAATPPRPIEPEPSQMSDSVRAAVFDAREEARCRGHQAADVEHLALALLQRPRGDFAHKVEQLGFAPSGVIRRLRLELERIPRSSGLSRSVDLTGRAKRLLSRAESSVRDRDGDLLGENELFIALLAEPSTTGIGRIFKALGLERDGQARAMTDTQRF